MLFPANMTAAKARELLADLHDMQTSGYMVCAWNGLRSLEITPGFPPVNWYEDEEEGMITVDGDAYYHSSGDTPENTTDKEPWNMGWCARIGMLTALRFMSGD